jgi:hypothetical protein
VAALDALAQQADLRLMDTVATHLSDKKQAVRSAAARHYSTVECERIRSSAGKYASLGATETQVAVASSADTPLRGVRRGCKTYTIAGHAFCYRCVDAANVEVPLGKWDFDAGFS